jgi:NAD(P)-dependent dehydrogenase (short-subunit alcohol dehydrogenase family)
MKLTSNTVLITGGASGIGYELTKRLTALGNTILVTGRDQARMDRAKAAFPKIHVGLEIPRPVVQFDQGAKHRALLLDLMTQNPPPGIPSPHEILSAGQKADGSDGGFDGYAFDRAC